MAWLNYHHLLYFWTVARTGSVTKACEELNLTQPAVSAQIKALERSLGEKLFAKRGRGLVLTEVGRVVFRYADEIFRIGRELQGTLASHEGGQPHRLIVGVADQVPKFIVYRLLESSFRGPDPFHLVLRDDKIDRLLADLALHEVDLVIADDAVGNQASVRAFNHLLGETGVGVYAAPDLAAKYKGNFPKSLHGAPFIMPPTTSALSRSLTLWFDKHQVQPDVIAEIEDSAVMKVFGQGGIGLFASPTAIEKDVTKQFHVERLGVLDGITERFYAISVERRITHPVVRQITSAARERLFG
jgi:LysR family transcriptional activator of nhaA